MDPVLLLLLCSSAAAVAAPLGVLPLKSPGQTPERWIGWANALAAGFMLGNGMVLAEAGLEHPPLQGALGALAGVGLVYLVHAASGTAELDLNRVDETPADYGYKIVFVSTLHAALEGVAIGVAMFHSVPLGVWVALSMGAHNAPEGTVLGTVLMAKGASRPQAALIAAASNVGQVFLAISAYAVISAAPGVFPVAVGFSVGTLVFLTLSEPLPHAYGRSGTTGIAVVTSVAMGVVVLFGGGAS